jgi:hypothetical protein
VRACVRACVRAHVPACAIDNAQYTIAGRIDSVYGAQRGRVRAVGYVRILANVMGAVLLSGYGCRSRRDYGEPLYWIT